MRAVHGRIADLYGRHIYVCDKLDVVEKENFDRIRQRDPEFASWPGTLGILSKYLRAYYNRKCYVAY